MRAIKERPHAITFVGKGRTKQAHADECDINKMMAKYQKTGVEPRQNRYPATYGDFTGITTFQGAHQQLQDADEAFKALPSGIRRRFENDAGKLLGFLEDPQNTAEAVDRGRLAASSTASHAEAKHCSETGNLLCPSARLFCCVC